MLGKDASGEAIAADRIGEQKARKILVISKLE